MCCKTLSSEIPMQFLLPATNCSCKINNSAKQLAKVRCMIEKFYLRRQWSKLSRFYIRRTFCVMMKSGSGQLSKASKEPQICEVETGEDLIIFIENTKSNVARNPALGNLWTLQPLSTKTFFGDNDWYRWKSRLKSSSNYAINPHSQWLAMQEGYLQRLGIELGSPNLLATI